jgi:L-amino acid N-acyltransferase YncA
MPDGGAGRPPIWVRLAAPSDGAACAAIYRPYVASTAVSFELQPPAATEMTARISRTLVRTPWLVAEMDGTVRGYAYGTRHRDRPAYDWTVETTVYVDRTMPRQGIGRATMVELLDVLRLQGFHLAVAGVTLPNAGSVGLHTALGFRPIGVFEAIGFKGGTWHGVAWYGLELGPRPDAPTAPTPLPELIAAGSLRRWQLGADRAGQGA